MPLTTFKICHKIREKFRDYAEDMEFELDDFAITCRERSSYADTIGARDTALKLKAIGSMLQRCSDLAFAIQEEDLLPKRYHPRSRSVAEMSDLDSCRTSREQSVVCDRSHQQDLIERFLLASQGP